VTNFTPTNNVSVVFWLLNRLANQTGRIVALSDAWEIYLQADGTIGNDLHRATTTLSSVTSFESETRYHVVCTRASDNTRQIFVDGVFDNSDSGGTAALPSAALLYLGVKQDITNYLTGLIEDVRIYDRVLSASEVATIYSSKGTDGIVYGLNHRWKMDEGSEEVVVGAGSVKDVGPIGLNATPTNGPKFKGTTMKYKRFG